MERYLAQAKQRELLAEARRMALVRLARRLDEERLAERRRMARHVWLEFNLADDV